MHGRCVCHTLKVRALEGPDWHLVRASRPLSDTECPHSSRTATVSCFHLSITCVGASYFVIDDSTNGTYIDAARAQRGTPTPLTSGAVITLCAAEQNSGKVIAFRFEALSHTAAAMEQARANQAEWTPDDSEAPATACVVCWAAHVRVLYLPCTHLCVCAACDSSLHKRKCPLCQADVTSSIQVRFP